MSSSTHIRFIILTKLVDVIFLGAFSAFGDFQLIRLEAVRKY